MLNRIIVEVTEFQLCRRDFISVEIARLDFDSILTKFPDRSALAVSGMKMDA